jgi:hypothetical protein
VTRRTLAGENGDQPVRAMTPPPAPGEIDGRCRSKLVREREDLAL